jgi:hypothetical protein
MVFELRKRVASDAPVRGGDACGCPLLSVRPALAASLLEERFADGAARRTSTLLVFLHEGTLKACLRDRDSDETAWVTADSLAGLLDALEAGLQEGRLDWRREGRRPARKK